MYGCDDQRTIVIVSTSANPAFPFYFIFSPDNNRYRLYGEGTGRKEATQAAFKELEALSAQQISALVTEANSGRK
jgi:hypothetical protein